MARRPLAAVGRARFAARTVRMIATRFPTIGVFDDIADDEDDLRAAFEIEDLTSTRQVASERLRQIPGGEVAAGGVGASLVMASFLYADERGGRFTDHRLGAWYAACELETAIQETLFHNRRRLAASAGGFPVRIQMRELVAELNEDFLDLRGRAAERPELYDPQDYAASQAFAAGRRWPFADAAEAGVIYDSVRRAGGTNVCVWRPLSVPLPVLQGDHYEYVWSAQGEVTVLKLTNVDL